MDRPPLLYRGPENALALAAVEALARRDPGAASPLVLVGPSGAGKTRLLKHLAESWLAAAPGSSLATWDAEQFAAACAEAAGSGEDGPAWSDLRNRLRGLDLLVLDDLTGLERAPASVPELEATLDALEGRGSVVVVASREGPGQWSGPIWNRRLVGRLAGGLVVRLEGPGPESRRRYLLDRASGLGLRIAAEALDLLAESETAGGYRTLEGRIARLAWLARVERHAKAVGRDDVAALLAEEDAVPEIVETETSDDLDTIARAVARRFGVTLKALKGPGRRPALAEARHLSMALARRRTGLSYAVIGAYHGGRDPATVRHACRAVEARLAADPALAAAVEALVRTLRLRVLPSTSSAASLTVRTDPAR